MLQKNSSLMVTGALAQNIVSNPLPDLQQHKLKGWAFGSFL
jgi:hypothetical protein